MHKSKNARALVMITALMLLLLSVLMGCGCVNSLFENLSGASARRDTANEAALSRRKLDPYEIKWYIDAGEPQADQQTVADEINRQLKGTINAALNLVSIDWGTYDQKMQMVIAAGEKFDLCFSGSWANNYYLNVNNGAFLPLNGLLDRYAPTILAALPKIGWEACKINGSIYAIPNYQIWALTNEFVIMKGLADKYNFDTRKVAKLEDLEPLLAAVKNGEPDVTPAAFCKGNLPWGGILANNNFDEIAGRDVPGVVRLDDAACKVLNQFETDEYRKNVRLLRDWYQKAYLRKDAGTLSEVQGKVAFNTGGCYKPGGAVGQESAYGEPVYDLPASKSYLVTSMITGDMTAVSKTSRDPARAVMFYDLLFKDKTLYNTLCLGIENRHYIIDADGKAEMIENSGYDYSSLGWEFGNQLNEIILKGQDLTIWEDTLKINNTAIASPALGFNFNPEPIKNELAKCNSLVQEYHPMLDTGTVDPEKVLPEFLSKLKAAGVDTIIAEEQKQVDQWRKNNGK